MIRHKSVSCLKYMRAPKVETTRRCCFYSIWRGTWRCRDFQIHFSVFGLWCNIYSIIHQIIKIFSNKQNQGTNYNILYWRVEPRKTTDRSRPQPFMVSFSSFKPTSIHSAECPVIAMILRDTTMKIAVLQIQI